MWRKITKKRRISLKSIMKNSLSNPQFSISRKSRPFSSRPYKNRSSLDPPRGNAKKVKFSSTISEFPIPRRPRSVYKSSNIQYQKYEERNRARNIKYKYKLLGNFDFIDRKRRVLGNRNYRSNFELNPSLAKSQGAQSHRLSKKKVFMNVPKGYQDKSAFTQRVPAIMMRKFRP